MRSALKHAVASHAFAVIRTADPTDIKYRPNVRADPFLLLALAGCSSLTTADGKMNLDLTPPYEEEARREYRPILSVDFE